MSEAIELRTTVEDLHWFMETTGMLFLPAFNPADRHPLSDFTRAPELLAKAAAHSATDAELSELMRQIGRTLTGEPCDT